MVKIMFRYSIYLESYKAEKECVRTPGKALGPHFMVVLLKFLVSEIF